MTTPPALEVREVTVRYGDVLALDNVTVEIGRGVVCGLLGANGSGKSTLLKTIAELVTPQSGHVRIHGLPPAQARKNGGEHDSLEQRPLTRHPESITPSGAGREGVRL